MSVTMHEWLAWALENGLVENTADPVPFSEVFAKYLAYKSVYVRPQTVDRIEGVYMRYFKGTYFDCAPVQEADTAVLKAFCIYCRQAHGHFTPPQRKPFLPGLARRSGVCQGEWRFGLA